MAATSLETLRFDNLQLRTLPVDPSTEGLTVQRQVPGAAHTPCPAPAEQLLAHTGRLQSSPPQPS